jgi:hypothetical protein
MKILSLLTVKILSYMSCQRMPHRNAISQNTLPGNVYPGNARQACWSSVLDLTMLTAPQPGPTNPLRNYPHLANGSGVGAGVILARPGGSDVGIGVVGQAGSQGVRGRVPA